MLKIMYINASFYWQLITNTSIFPFLIFLSVIFNILITWTSHSCSTMSLISSLSLFKSALSTRHNLHLFSSLHFHPHVYHQFTPFLSPTPPSRQLHQTAHHHDVTTVQIYKSCSTSSLSNPRNLTGCWVPLYTPSYLLVGYTPIFVLTICSL
jgi:hypothetical protein